MLQIISKEYKSFWSKLNFRYCYWHFMRKAFWNVCLTEPCLSFYLWIFTCKSWELIAGLLDSNSRLSLKQTGNCETLFCYEDTGSEKKLKAFFSVYLNHDSMWLQSMSLQSPFPYCASIKTLYRVSRSLYTVNQKLFQLPR